MTISILARIVSRSNLRNLFDTCAKMGSRTGMRPKLEIEANADSAISSQRATRARKKSLEQENVAGSLLLDHESSSPEVSDGSGRTKKAKANDPAADMKAEQQVRKDSNKPKLEHLIIPEDSLTTVEVMTPHNVGATKGPAVFMAMVDESSPSRLQSVESILADFKTEEERRRAVNEAEEHGYTALMRCSFVEEERVCGMLLEAKADVLQRDLRGNNSLHWAAFTGNEGVMGLLLGQRKGGGGVDDANAAGETPMHIASCKGHEKVCVLLLQHGADPRRRNLRFQTPLDVAAVDNASSSSSSSSSSSTSMAKGGKLAMRVSCAARKRVRKAILSYDKDHGGGGCRVLVVHHDDCLEHHTKVGHQEAPDRVRAILAKLRSTRGADKFEDYELSIDCSFEPAREESVLRVHSRAYVSFVRELSEQVASSEGPVPFTPRVQTALASSGTRGGWETADGEGDTFFSKGSYRAALRAAGGVCHAIDQVVRGKARAAFCCVRPPGHHAGKDGLIKDCISCGFCIFNNVVVGAVHAIETYGEKARRERRLRKRSDTTKEVKEEEGKEKGGEEVKDEVEEGQEVKEEVDDGEVKVKVEQSDGKEEEDQTGKQTKKDQVGGANKEGREQEDDEDEDEDEDEERVVIRKVAIVDLDVHHGNGTEELVRLRSRQHPDEMFFFSIHLFQPQHTGIPEAYEFYPGTGGGDIVQDNVVNVPIYPCWCVEGNGPSKRTRVASKREPGEGGGACSVLPGWAGQEMFKRCHGRNYFRSQIQHKLLPTLRAFSPDLIILSMGFDGAEGDVGNANLWLDNMPGGLDLTCEVGREERED
ncbi:hypothetical protein GUITHDRAFT_120362 [Guillardia theta CCMP2712]|uniref:histone deacetylase n=1 Tax=Guillardia theta (strain CCMP2712) TaxID=905079 RepID=L1IC93_GUITC|nr:hypothetical protein GUITHDRAFT_120362 [Guillardia theta CCMP2712]EKX33460.1 hypothetical protein GUITHDRAFT_120362 [Guillardia theta CCMP2712]|eukprot:XP_005820440.1 hypothetical protein GUITHDRAFT_120362 [Guillardia theta CCMP2712]